MASFINSAVVVRMGAVLLACTAAPGFSAAPAAGKPHHVELPGRVALEMIWISPGGFTMGSPASEPHRHADEGPQTRVTLSRGFWLGRTPVTIGQWQAVMGRDVRGQLMLAIDDDTLYDFGGKRQTKRDYMGFSRERAAEYLAGESAELPMYFVTWDDAMEFCRRLTSLERAAGRLPSGYEYDLPTEAQWEYAARAGTSTPTYDEPLDAIAWYVENSADGYRGKGFAVASGAIGGPRAVAGKRPNYWGLYDMAGNVWQWCRDWYGPFDGGTAIDPAGPASGTARVNRGGSFGSGAGDERSASRAGNPPAEASAYRGFRLALVYQVPSAGTSCRRSTQSHMYDVLNSRTKITSPACDVPSREQVWDKISVKWRPQPLVDPHNNLSSHRYEHRLSSSSLSTKTSRLAGSTNTNLSFAAGVEWCCWCADC